jgi:hypothetical protein
MKGFAGPGWPSFFSCRQILLLSVSRRPKPSSPAAVADRRLSRQLS